MPSSRFSHWLLQAVGYEALLHSDRRALHEHCAEAIEARGSGPTRSGGVLGDDELAQLLATDHDAGHPLEGCVADLSHHWERSAARPPRRAWLFRIASAKLRDRECRFAESARDAEVACRQVGEAGLVVDRALANLALGRALRRVGQVDRAGERLREALELAGPELGGPLAITLRNALGALFADQARFGEADALHREALERARRDGDRRGEAQSLQNVASVLGSQGRQRESEAMYARSIELAERLGDTRLRAGSQQGLATLRSNVGATADSVRLFDEALASARAIGDVRLVAYCLHGLALHARRQVDDARTETLWGEAIARCDAIGERRLGGVCRHGLGSLRLDQGRLGEALSLLQHARRVAREVRDRRLETVCASSEAAAAVTTGDLVRADELAAESLRLALSTGDRRAEALAELLQAEVFAERGACVDAIAVFSRAVRTLEEIESRDLLALALAGRAVARRRAGDAAGATDDAGRAASVARAAADDASTSAAELAVALCRGDAPRALELAADAERAGRAPDRCRALLVLAEICAEAGDSDAARTAASQAASIADAHGMARLSARARETGA